MSELVVIAYNDPHQADQVLSQLNLLQKEHLIDLDDAVVAVRQPNGKVHLKQSVSMTGAGAATGGISGALWGTLVGLLFLNPLAGFAIGTAVGAGAGAVAGKLSDYGIDDSMMKQMGQSIPPNGSALFILVRRAQPEKVLAEVGRYGGQILRTSLAPAQEARLQQALAAGTAAAPPMAGATPAPH